MSVFWKLIQACRGLEPKTTDQSGHTLIDSHRKHLTYVTNVDRQQPPVRPTLCEFICLLLPLRFLSSSAFISRSNLIKCLIFCAIRPGLMYLHPS